jgi:hypothetical protein
MNIHDLRAEIEAKERELDRLCTQPYAVWQDKDAELDRLLDLMDELLEEEMA